MAAPKITWKFANRMLQAGWQDDSVETPYLRIIRLLLDISCGLNLSQTVQALVLASGPHSLTVSKFYLIENYCSFVTLPNDSK